jgi:hypothetical protein
MPNIPKAMFVSHCLGPLFNCATFNFNSLAATFAHQVVMVGVSAQAIDSFTIFSAQHINNFVID